MGSDSSHCGVSELVSDINSPLMNFWQVLQDETTFAKFQRIVEAIPLARSEWSKLTLTCTAAIRLPMRLRSSSTVGRAWPAGNGVSLRLPGTGHVAG
jgi:hypothetical protein